MAIIRFKKLTPKKKSWIEKTLKKLSFVRWDRYVEFEEGIEFYGWISRKDGKFDFLVLDFFSDGFIDYSTSSAKYSLKILYMIGGKRGEHNPCKRIEKIYTLKNMIKVTP